MRRWILLILIFAGCDVVENNTVNSPLIVLTFDDGSKSIYELAYQEMKKYDYPGVNFIPSIWINKKNWLSAVQLHELEDNGWETGGHTVTHANLTTITIDSARYEIEQNYKQLLEYNLSHKCFALPFGHSNEKINKIIKEYFDIIRTSQNDRYTYPLNLDRLGYYQAENTDDANSLLMRIAHGINQGEVLIIIGFHSFTTGKEDFITKIHISKFVNFLRGLHERNLKVVTLSNAVELLK